ncbi:MAG: dimethyl sulfoxide reductase anchor subunit, partial [Kangiellaceae bacterium]|nr:dimethyl sulfoxide reductase anchor subunit [Kangiellaceae bacterium]
QPNIRFQQIKDLPETMTRTDSAPVKYHRDASGDFKPMVDQKKGKARHWSLSKLSSRENPLVIFTLAAQASVGAVTMLTAGELLGVASFVQFTSSIIYSPLLVVCLLLIGLGLFMSTLHLGKPLRFYRGFNNLRHSPVCREGLGIALFMTFLAGQIVFSLLDNFVFTSLWTSLFEFPVTDLIAPSFSDSIATTMKVLAVVSGFVGIYYMNRCYRIKARPFWNHWQVASSFFGNLLSLGALIAGAAMVGVQAFNGQDYQSTLSIFTTLFVTGLALESFGLFVHGRAMSAAEHEGAASHYVQLTTFGKSYFLRNALLLVSLIFATSLLIIQPTGALALIYWLVISASVLLSSLIGRALFYVLVIPTTMPGAFFWKNKGFEEHARDIGLAKMEQVGVK